MTEFLNHLKSLEEFFSKTTGGIFAKIDQVSFKMVIDCLKSNDSQAVTIAIDQLVKEKRPVSIPPLYVVAKAHPNPMVRAKAEQALKKLDPQNDVEKLTGGKDMKEAVYALVERYGNFKG